jgi:hypothetical protein
MRLQQSVDTIQIRLCCILSFVLQWSAKDYGCVIVMDIVCLRMLYLGNHYGGYGRLRLEIWVPESFHFFQWFSYFANLGTTRRIWFTGRWWPKFLDAEGSLYRSFVLKYMVCACLSPLFNSMSFSTIRLSSYLLPLGYCRLAVSLFLLVPRLDLLFFEMLVCFEYVWRQDGWGVVLVFCFWSCMPLGMVDEM